MGRWTDAFVRLCDAFYRLVSVSDLLAPMFAHIHPSMPGTSPSGSPRFSADRRPTPLNTPATRSMLAHHLGTVISEAQRRRWVNLMMDAADEVGLPGDPEFRAGLAQ